MYEVISNSLKELEQGKNIVLATVVNTKGSTPQKIGSKLLSLSHSSFLNEGFLQQSPWTQASRD